jgi:hypothetical protein
MASGSYETAATASAQACRRAGRALGARQRRAERTAHLAEGNLRTSGDCESSLTGLAGHVA